MLQDHQAAGPAAGFRAPGGALAVSGDVFCTYRWNPER
jgi:hypothetical protein